MGGGSVGVGGDDALLSSVAAMIAPEEAVDAATTTTTTDDKEGNEQASLVGPALLPEAVSAYTTASQLLYQWCAAKASGTEMPDEIIVDVHVPQ